MKREQKEKIIIAGKCCRNKPKFSALYNNEPLDNFIILLCTDHAFSEPFTNNVIKIKKIEYENE